MIKILKKSAVALLGLIMASALTLAPLSPAYAVPVPPPGYEPPRSSEQIIAALKQFIANMGKIIQEIPHDPEAQKFLLNQTGLNDTLVAGINVAQDVIEIIANGQVLVENWGKFDGQAFLDELKRLHDAVNNQNALGAAAAMVQVAPKTYAFVDVVKSVVNLIDRVNNLSNASLPDLQDAAGRIKANYPRLADQIQTFIDNNESIRTLMRKFDDLQFYSLILLAGRLLENASGILTGNVNSALIALGQTLSDVTPLIVAFLNETPPLLSQAFHEFFVWSNSLALALQMGTVALDITPSDSGFQYRFGGSNQTAILPDLLRLAAQPAGAAIIPVENCFNPANQPDAKMDYTPCFSESELAVMGPNLKKYLKSFSGRQSLTEGVNYQPATLVYGQNNLVIPWIGRGIGEFAQKWGKGINDNHIADYVSWVKLIVATGKVKRIEIGPPGLTRNGELFSTDFEVRQMPIPCLPPGIQFGKKIDMVSNPADVVKILKSEITLKQARLVTVVDTNFIEGVASIIATLEVAAESAASVIDCAKSYETLYNDLISGKLNILDAIKKAGDLGGVPGAGSGGAKTPASIIDSRFLDIGRFTTSTNLLVPSPKVCALYITGSGFEKTVQGCSGEVSLEGASGTLTIKGVACGDGVPMCGMVTLEYNVGTGEVKQTSPTPGLGGQPPPSDGSPPGDQGDGTPAINSDPGGAVCLTGGSPNVTSAGGTVAWRKDQLKILSGPGKEDFEYIWADISPNQPVTNTGSYLAINGGCLNPRFGVQKMRPVNATTSEGSAVTLWQCYGDYRGVDLIHVSAQDLFDPAGQKVYPGSPFIKTAAPGVWSVKFLVSFQSEHGAAESTLYQGDFVVAGAGSAPNKPCAQGQTCQNGICVAASTGVTRGPDGRLRSPDGTILPTKEECLSIIRDYDKNGDQLLDALELSEISNLWVEEKLPDNDNTYAALLACESTLNFEAGAGAPDSGSVGPTPDKHWDINNDSQFEMGDCNKLADDAPNNYQKYQDPTYDFDGSGAVDAADAVYCVDQLNQMPEEPVPAPEPPAPADQAFQCTLTSAPDPFTAATAFTFTAQGNKGISKVIVHVFDVAGNELTRAENAGASVTWNGQDNDGQPLPNGTYLYQVDCFGPGPENKDIKTGKLKIGQAPAGGPPGPAVPKAAAIQGPAEVTAGQQDVVFTLNITDATFAKTTKIQWLSPFAPPSQNFQPPDGKTYTVNIPEELVEQNPINVVIGVTVVLQAGQLLQDTYTVTVKNKAGLSGAGLSDRNDGDGRTSPACQTERVSALMLADLNNDKFIDDQELDKATKQYQADQLTRIDYDEIVAAWTTRCQIPSAIPSACPPSNPAILNVDLNKDRIIDDQELEAARRQYQSGKLSGSDFDNIAAAWTLRCQLPAAAAVAGTCTIHLDTQNVGVDKPTTATLTYVLPGVINSATINCGDGQSYPISCSAGDCSPTQCRYVREGTYTISGAVFFSSGGSRTISCQNKVNVGASGPVAPIIAKAAEGQFCQGNDQCLSGLCVGTATKICVKAARDQRQSGSWCVKDVAQCHIDFMCRQNGRDLNYGQIGQCEAKAGDQARPDTTDTCGNGRCETDEDQNTCPSDCKPSGEF